MNLQQFRDLCAACGGQRASARLLHVSERVVRKWCAGDSDPPFACVALLTQFMEGIWMPEENRVPKLAHT